jgi:hypothetical protein
MTRPSMQKRGMAQSTGQLSKLQISMDHRIKSGGDEECVPLFDIVDCELARKPRRENDDCYPSS